MKRSGHVEIELSLWLDGALGIAAGDQIEAHLAGCRRCAEAAETIRRAREVVLSLPLHDAPEALWTKIEASLDTSEVAAPRRFVWRPTLALASLAVLTLSLLLVPGRGKKGKLPAFEIASFEGTPMVGSQRLDASTRLPQGEWLQTDGRSKAVVKVARIGTVELMPHSRLRLLGSSEKEHRMELQTGELHAKIEAPPRLFVVVTPSATAIDLGCEYTLQVGSEGRTELHVTFGEVALARRKGLETVVPAGMKCATSLVHGLGTPYVEDAPAELRSALERIDKGEGGPRETAIVLENASQRNALTLFYLVARDLLPKGERERYYRALAGISPPPAGVTEEGILGLDPAMLARWHAEVKLVWWE